MHLPISIMSNIKLSKVHNYHILEMILKKHSYVTTTNNNLKFETKIQLEK